MTADDAIEVDVRPIDEADLDAFRRLHNEFVDREESPETVRAWYEEHPDLLVGAYHEGDLRGHCLGRPWEVGVVELAGIAVEPGYRRRGIGSGLLATFEDRAASLGFERVTLGSAGGYVDEFYARNGYEAASVLVRLDPGDVPENYREMGYDIAAEAVEAGTRKLYVGVDERDPDFLESVREAFGDPDAIYVMENEL